MSTILLTKYDGAILGPIANVLGYVMQGLYWFFDTIGQAIFSTEGANIGLCIIAFTFVIKMLMMPMTFKQQKFSKLSAAMNPELQAIQKKYQGKRDNDSMLKMQEETKMVYEKYGTSPTGSCLQLVIQMPVFFALYRVMMNIPAYIPQLKAYYETAINEIGTGKIIDYIHSLDKMKDVDLSSTSLLIDKLATFTNSDWISMVDKIGANAQASAAIDHINSLNSFFGVNLSAAPIAAMGIALLIPILAGLSQWYTSKLMMTGQQAPDTDNPMAGSMKMMNTIMPIFSAVICFTMSSGLGLYWIASSVVTIIQQLVINAHFKKVEVDDLIKENIEKANKKRAKKGLPPQKITNAANIHARTAGQTQNKPIVNQEELAKKRQEQLKKSTEYYNANAKPGSLAAKANMVRMYDEKNDKKRK